jgi:hypothetical protein
VNAQPDGLVERFDNSVQQACLACALRAENGKDDFLRLAGPIFKRMSAGPLRTDCVQPRCGAKKQRGWHSRAAFAGTMQYAEPARPDVPVRMFTCWVRAQVCWIGYLLETGNTAHSDMPHEKPSVVDDPESDHGTAHADCGDTHQHFVRQPDRCGQKRCER